jgi:uncharacterized protein YkwD
MGCSNSSATKTIEKKGNNKKVNLDTNFNKTKNEQKAENNGKIEQKVIDVQPKKESNKEKQEQNILKLEVKKEEKKEEIPTIKIEQKQEKEEKQENNKNENQVKKPENSQQNITSVAQKSDNIETDNFDEKDFPVFEYDFYKKHIQNYKRILIEKADNGTVNIHKIFFTFNYNENKTKIIEIEKTEKRDQTIKHLKKRVLKGCSPNDNKEILEKYNKEFKIDTKLFTSQPKTSDLYIKAQKEGSSLIRNEYIYDKKNIKFSVKSVEMKGNSFSSSSSNITGIGPEDVVNEYNETQTDFLDNAKEEYSLIPNVPSDPSKFSKFSQEHLEMHNKYRKMHHVPDLELNQELCDIAQKYAEYLAKNSLLEHSYARFKGAGMGENLYMCSGFIPNGGDAVTSWYNEIKDYDFKKGKSANGGVVGHFTQVVWKESKYLGVGIGKVDNSYYVVANYFPAGNFNNLELENVFPK